MEFELNTCSGCMACMNVCPKNAISTIESPEGFILPHIDKDKCVNCGLCEEVCDFKRSEHVGNDMQQAFSLVHHDKQVIERSSSGGAFTALSDKMLGKGGVVFGATYDDDFNVIHSVAFTAEERDRMRGSKYVQCNPRMSYRDVKKFLADRPVLFVGTPCQCAGLKSYLKKDYDNLFVVDFLCHGVPSNKMFKEHIACISKKHQGQAIDYSFRTKKYGWNGYASVVTFVDSSHKCKDFEKKQRHIEEDSSWAIQSFFTFFASNMSLRPSCFNCPYRNTHRPSDITIGDFWQIEYLTGKKDKEGVSFVTANSPKGEALLAETAKDVRMKEYTLDQVKFRLPNGATKKPKRYEEFWNTYQDHGYEKVLQKYFDNSMRARMRWVIKKISKRMRII